MKRLMMILTLAAVFCSTLSFAGSSYVYRSRANWVKVSKLSNKQLAGQTLNHPYEMLSTDQMTAMLQSLQLNRHKMFKNEEFKTSEIFSPIEAKKYAPLLVQALKEAGPNEIVNMAIVHKRPYFILRNDFISVINVFAKEDGVHFHFAKLFARLNGDYQQASQVDESIRKAKSVRISLDSSEGQSILGDGNEIVLNPNYDFATNQALAVVTPTTQTAPVKTAVTKPVATKPAASVLTPEPVTTNEDVQSRLSKLEELKKSKLITSAEYKQKRAEILSQL